LDVRLAGLCDAAEEADFQRGLERAGLGSHLARAEMETLGFYVCAERSDTRVSSSRRSISPECLGRWTTSLLMSDSDRQRQRLNFE
jgi:hypothetical protein